jgi:sulfur carrier protein
MGGRPYPFRDAVFCFMKLILNGEFFETLNAGTITDLLNELGIEPGQVAVEVNLSIIRRADHSTFRLHEGDRVEIVNFVGGG